MRKAVLEAQSQRVTTRHNAHTRKRTRGGVIRTRHNASQRAREPASARGLPLTLREERALEYLCPRDVMARPQNPEEFYISPIGPVCARQVQSGDSSCARKLIMYAGAKGGATAGPANEIAER